MLEYDKCLNDILNHTTSYNLYFACLLLSNLAIELNINNYQLKQDFNIIKNKIKFESNIYNASILDIDDAYECYINKTSLVYNNKLLKQFMEDF